MRNLDVPKNAIMWFYANCRDYNMAPEQIYEMIKESIGKVYTDVEQIKLELFNGKIYDLVRDRSYLRND